MKKKIDQELARYIKNLEKDYSLTGLCPLLTTSIKEFILRDGKRIRPILFLAGYLGFAKNVPSGLYSSAISIELLHDFMLIHDDIIDKSDIRRGKPSLHKVFNNYLRNSAKVKFSGEDLALVAGDILYALALGTFLSIKELPERKEKALRQLIKAALYTGTGEFIELLAGLKSLQESTQKEIYKIYDYKTAYYTFSSPLAMGAMLAGAETKETDKLIQYGLYLGRAFQIKDDILGMFGQEKEIGKPLLTDLQEAKKTLLVWHAYKYSSQKEKTCIKKIFNKKIADKKDLQLMQKIIIHSASLDFAKGQMTQAVQKAKTWLDSSRLRPTQKQLLQELSSQILNI